jgi:hypothetical protein
VIVVEIVILLAKFQVLIVNHVRFEALLCIVRRLIFTVNVAPFSPILVSLMMDVMHSSETSVLTRATIRKISGDGILFSHRREDIKILHSINWLGSVAVK